ncbi:hypothetical protein [Citrobacter sedlakii]|uniref:hypothetical protein n=1 Tax=Citrobacter sedlakii TaxID=67826 RepID=UPI0005A8E437|nr:hypothetical protein [Citrobacter sedlakii]
MLSKKCGLAFIFTGLMAWYVIQTGTESPPHPESCLPSPYADYNPAPVFTRWQWESPAERGLANSPRASLDDTNILVWLDGKKRIAADKMTLAIAADWNTLAPKLSDLLKQENFSLQSASMPVAYLEEDWGQTLLSHRPEVATSLAEKFVTPKLWQAQQAGYITAKEVEHKTNLAISQHWLWRAPQELIKQPELQEEISFTEARKTYSVGDTKRTTYLKIMDASAVFGEPKVALILTTCVVSPNPNYSYLKAIANRIDYWKNFTLLGPGLRPLQSYLSDKLVLEESIKPITTYLKKNNLQSELASEVTAWVKKVPLAETTPERQSAETTSSDAMSMVTITLKDLLSDTDDSREIKEYKELPDGNSLFATKRYDRQQQNYVSELYITEPGNPQHATHLWQGESLSGLTLVHKGQKAWFKTSSGQWFELNIPTREIATLALNEETGVTSWFSDANGNPITFSSDYSDEGKGCLIFRRIDPRISPPENSLFKTCRNHFASGNSIQPVLISTPGYFWLEDSNGLVKLNSETGRAELSYTVPFRSPADIRSRRIDLSADDITRHTPYPLGSSEAHWIALHYQHQSPLQHHMNAWRMGTYFIDSLSGKWRFSAELKNADSITATARSAHGRFFAQAGCEKPAGSGITADIWDVASATKIASLHRLRYCGLKNMAFNWQGNTLILVFHDRLIRVRLPDNRQDAATAEAIPTESKN